MLKTAISPSFCKITGLQSIDGVTSYNIAMAKNESEGCVISLYSQNKYAPLFLFCESKECIKVEFEKEHTLKIDGTDYPDPLVPINGSFDLEAGIVTNIFVRFTTYASTPSGNYEFKIFLRNAGGDILADYTVTVKVWGFALPEVRSIESAVGISYDGIAYHYGYSDVKSATPVCPTAISVDEGKRKNVDELYKTYYDFLLNRRICGYYLPFDILDDRADAYMSDPKVTSFRLNDNADDATLIQYYKKVCSDPTWMKKAYFYPFDEPTTVEHLDEIKKRVKRLNSLCPGIRCTSPFYWNAVYDKDTDEVQVLLDNLDLMCPKITSWNDNHIYRFPGQMERYGSFLNRMKKAKEQGKQLWQYVCWEPGKPYVNLYVNESGLDHRVLFWMQHKIGATGFLYWRANFWREIEDPWTDMATVPGLSKNVYGDGSLVYPGDKVGIYGPCGSLRLEIIKDGLEDCEMLRMASEVLGAEWVEKKITEVVRSVTDYTENERLFLDVRTDIGNALEIALSSL